MTTDHTEPSPDSTPDSTSDSAKSQSPLFFLSAGEPSGDIHAAELVRALKKRFPTARFVAYGGPEMQKAGCETPVLLTELAVMWFGRVLWHLRTFLRYLRDAKRFFEREKPDLVILVDFPGFNWLIAKRAKAAGVPVCYFMPPQIWSWAQHRVKKMKKYVDFTLSTLPFEEKWFRSHGVNAEYIGHPFFAEVRQKRLDTDFLARLAPDDAQRPILLILPGSRNQEVAVNFADMLDAARRVSGAVSSVRPMIGAFQERQAEQIRARLVKERLDWPVFVGKTPELMAACTCALAVSGSVSMELLARTKPTVIYYRLSRLAHLVMRRYICVKYITLVNLLAADRTDGESLFYDHRTRLLPKEPTERQREISLFPEFLVDSNRSQAAAEPLIEWLTNHDALEHRRKRLAELLQAEDDGTDPIERAAEIIANRIEQPPAL